VVDVLPTAVPVLKALCGKCAVLFYCHFPDKLLTRDTVNGVPIASFSSGGVFRSVYRRLLDRLEEYSMSFSDLIVVNSKFTKGEVLQAFPSLSSSHGEDNIKVLYPAIDLSKFTPPDFTNASSTQPIVSLNRYERKKNIDILLHAYAILLQKIEDKEMLPKLIIAGGYDPRNTENVEYFAQLQTLAHQTLSIPSHLIEFQRSLSDQQRSTLLQKSLCVVYTPFREHFGIVPLEAMYAGSPILAVNSGGPCETVLHGETGYLVENTPSAFADALYHIIRLSEEDRRKMALTAHQHIRHHFGLHKFKEDWMSCIQECIHRNIRHTFLFTWLCDLSFAFLLAYTFNGILKYIGLVSSQSNPWREVKFWLKGGIHTDEF